MTAKLMFTGTVRGIGKVVIMYLSKAQNYEIDVQLKHGVWREPSVFVESLTEAIQKMSELSRRLITMKEWNDSLKEM